MKNLYKLLRLLLLLFFIALAALVPVPLTLSKKDTTPKFVLEQLDEEEEEEEEMEIAKWG